MKKQYRVKKSYEIENIIKNKQSVGNKYFNLYKKENCETTNFRYAISVGKKIGNAVRRNRVKRQVRSIIDNICIIDLKIDVFVVCKSTINDIDFLEMKKQLIYLFKKNNIKIKGEKL